MTLSIINRLIAVLKFSKKLSDFIIYAKSLLTAMTSNSGSFSASAAKLTQLATDIAVLDNFETALHTHPPTATVAQRDAAKVVVINDLHALQSDVQTLADANPAQAASLINSASMFVKVLSIHINGKRVLMEELLLFH
jgi:hypothetical protein